MDYISSNVLTKSGNRIPNTTKRLFLTDKDWSSTLVIAITLVSIIIVYFQFFRSKFLDAKSSKIPVKSVAKDFSWDLVTPLKSYPFKNKEYKLTMGIRNVDPQDWLLVEPSYKTQLEEKRKILTNTHLRYPPEKDLTSLTLFVTKEAVPAIHEFYDIVVNYMCTKYPMHFTKKGSFLHNSITNETVPYSASKNINAETHLLNLARTIQEDFIILLKDPSREDEKDGTEYFFKGGVFAFAAGFDPKTRFNTPLSFVHHPIPGYEEKLKLSMNRFFTRIEPGQFVTRSNFSVQTHDLYYVDDANKGHNLPEDYDQKPIPFNELDFDTQVHYRSERQVLTKLPKSKAVVFTIRTYLEPISALKKEGPEVCDRLIGAINGFPHDIATYKRAYEWGPPVKQYLLQNDSAL